MTTPNQILDLLLNGPSTPAAIGETLHIPMLVADAICQRHQVAGLVSHTLIANIIPVYHLTDPGREAVRKLSSQTIN